MQRLGFSDREAFLRFSREDPERFWGELMRDMGVDWFEPYHHVADISRGPEWSQWFPGGKLNIAHNCLDRWAETDRIACIWESESGAARSMTFRELRSAANRVANGLRALGLEPGDRVALCLPTVPEILAILYGCFKAGLIVTPIFAGFGTGAIETRLKDSGARVLFTENHLVRRGKRHPLIEKMPATIEHTIVVSEGLFADQSDEASTAVLDSEARAFILYTSGTTGKPKGTVHTHAGCLAQIGKEVRYAFDARPGEPFFWVTDIGWMMGPWEIIGCLLYRTPIVLFDGAPNYPTGDRIWEICE